MKPFALVALFLTIAGCQAAPEETGKAAAPIAREPAAAGQAALGPRAAAAEKAGGHESGGGHQAAAAAAPGESCGGHQAAAGGHESCGGEKAAAAGGESCGGEKAGESCGSCAAATAGQVPDNAVTRTDPATGQTVTVAGGKLAGAPVVKVADLLAKPTDYAGKTVRLEGNVSGMCGHRRAWFAVASEDRSGNAVRVFAAPSFLVPPGSVGKRARTEGVVEVAAASGNAPARLVVRATGAEFM